MTLKLEGLLDKGALRQSIDTIVSRHEVLRTTFPDVDGSPHQSIAPVSDPRGWEWREVDLGEEVGDEEVENLLRAHAQGSFDLAKGPLFRAGLFRRGEDHHVLQVVMHHSVSDGWSVEVFKQELSTLYSAFLAGEPSPLPPLPIQYADFAIWHRQWLQEEAIQQHTAYWTGKLAGELPPLQLPTDRPRPPELSYHGDWHAFELKDGLADQLKSLCQAEGVTLHMLLLAAFQTLLSRYSGQDDIAVGTPSNSDLAALEYATTPPAK